MRNFIGVAIGVMLQSGCGGAGPLKPPASQDADAAVGRAAVAAQSSLPQPVNQIELLTCESMGGMKVYCGYQNPEDLVQIPGSNLLIVSEMGEFMADSPGALSLLNLETGEPQPLNISWDNRSGSNWGDASCAAPDAQAFSPHGIDLTIRDDGETALLVVNHGLRESVEFFAVTGTEVPTLVWRGCALPPDDPFINDVAARTDGGFYITHMWNKSRPFAELVASLPSGEPTGWVWAWAPAEGFSKVPNSDDLMPNGIAIDADNTTLFINMYLANKTVKLDVASGERRGSFDVRQPDNITVDADGNLWVASHQHDPLGQTCGAVTEGPCLLPFQVARVNADTLVPRIVIDQVGAPMGYGTVALKVGDELYIGSAHGDRIVSVPVPD